MSLLCGPRDGGPHWHSRGPQSGTAKSPWPYSPSDLPADGGKLWPEEPGLEPERPTSRVATWVGGRRKSTLEQAGHSERVDARSFQARIARAQKIAEPPCQLSRVVGHVEKCPVFEPSLGVKCRGNRPNDLCCHRLRLPQEL